MWWLRFLWRKFVGLKVKLIGVENSHRVMIIELLSGNRKCIIVGVYLPCFVNNDEYEGDVMMCAGFIESIFDMYKTDLNCTFLILGDFNFDCIKLSSLHAKGCHAGRTS